jgi:hypothetical protein
MAKRVAELLVDVPAEAASGGLRYLQRLAQRHYRFDSGNRKTGLDSSAA